MSPGANRWSREEALAAKTFSSLWGNGQPIIGDDDKSIELKDALVGKPGFNEAGDAVKSQHIVTLQAGKRLILRLRLQAPEECSQLERPYELGDVYIHVKTIDQSPAMKKFLFLGPWHFDDDEMRRTHCRDSYPLRSLK